MVDSLLESAIKNDDPSNIEEKLEDYCSSHVVTWTNNPLLLALKHGSVNCASEIFRFRPDLALARNSDGYTAMHTICESGNAMMVRGLVEISPQLCLLRDLTHGITPLHVVAINGHEQVLKEIIKVCPQSLATYTHRHETALHLSLIYDHVGCFQVLMDQLVDHMPMMININLNLKELLNQKDYQGNTVLHIATLRRQIQIVKMLLSDNPITSLVEVNATNQMGFTALDLHSQNHPSMIDMEITNLLLQAGPPRPNSSETVKEQRPPISQTNYNITAANERRTHQVMLKTVLLTVFILAAGGSYASLFNLNTVYPKEDYTTTTTTVGIGKSNNITISLKDMVMMRVHVPDLFLYMVLNTITFTGSVVVIVVNTWSLVTICSFCFRALPLIVMGSMCVSYALLVFKIIPKFSLTIIGSLQISSFWAVWLFSLPFIFLLLIVWLAFKIFSDNLEN